MTNATAHLHYQVVAGLSEGINFATLEEATAFGEAQAAFGMNVKVWAVDRDPKWDVPVWTLIN